MLKIDSDICSSEMVKNWCSQSQEATLMSQRARSMAASCNCGWAGLLAEERDPRRHMMAERHAHVY